MTTRPGPGTAGLSAAALLHLWERGAAQPPQQRALSILAAAQPGWTPEELAALPSGRRDRRLLAVYEQTFGPRLAAQGQCPACATPVEFALDTRTLAAGSSADFADDEAGPYTLAEQGYVVSYRLPDSRDLEAITALTGLGEARRDLLQRCILSASRDDAPLTVEALPTDVLDRVVAEMATRDPLAVIELEPTCPDCGYRWGLLLDIAAFLWHRIETQAGRLLREVHALARAYGWREADILALSQARRWAYLDLLQ